MKSIVRLLVLAVGVLVLFASPAVWAQASLADGDTCDFTITIDGHTEHVTCIKDAIKPEQWYYVPSKIRLDTMMDASTKKEMPVFSLVKYQAKDPEDPQKLLEGGVLQCAVNLALPAGGLDQLKKQIAEQTGKKEAEVLLSPLAMVDAKLTVWGPGGEKLGEAPQAPDVAPAFANQSIPVQINLNKLGADFSDALVKSGGGIPINITFSFNGLTPKAGFKVQMDYDQTFKHLSTDSKARVKWSHWFCSGSTKVDVSTVREDLTTNKCLTIESISGEHFTDEQIDKFMLPVIEKLQQEMFNMQEPEKVEPAKAAEPEAGRGIISVGVSFSLKSVEKVKKGKTVISMNRQQIMKRQTAVGGLITIANWPKDVKDKCVITMPAGNWASAWYSLPDVGDASSIGVTEVSVQVKVLDPNGKAVAKCPAQMAKWTAKDGVWKDAKNIERYTLMFPMAGVLDAYKGKEDQLKYEQTINVTQVVGGQTKKYTFKSTDEMFDGEAAVSTPMANLESVNLCGNLLTFYGSNYADSTVIPQSYRNKASDLTNVNVSLKTLKPSKTYTGTLTQKTPDFYVLVEKAPGDEEPKIEATVTFNSKKNKKVLTVKNLLEEIGDQWYLTDIDYLPEN
ncbi:MAG TPA: hypothetical protein VIV61_12080 [Candidatus Ozemobacteraceae bacterium]